MPLTTSHAAAAWPLTRLFPSLPLAAIVFGSMSPDFEYLVRLAPIGRSWHTVPGLVFYAVPAAILVWLVWRVAVRPSLASVWPPGLAGSISGRGFEMRELALAVPAVMAGAASHAIWDGFTHRGGWAVNLMPVLQTDVALGAIGEVPLNRVLQHASTLVGGIVVVLWFVQWWLAQPAERRVFAHGQRSRLALLVSLLLLASSSGAIANALRAPAVLPMVLGNAAVGWMLGAAAALLLWSAADRVVPRRLA